MTDIVKENYFNYGNSKNIVVSNSLMSHINPEEGGHPRKFLDALDKKLEQKETEQLENGKIIHAYRENPDSFKIYDTACKPTTELKENFLKLIAETGLEPDKIPPLELETLAKTAGYKKAPKSLSLEDNQYIDYLTWHNQNIPCVSSKQKEAIDGAIKSLDDNPLIQKFFAGDKIRIKEAQLTFTINDIPCKALVDEIVIDHNNKKVYIVDYKSISQSIYNIPPRVGYNGLMRSRRWYRQLEFYLYGLKSDKSFFKTHGIDIKTYTFSSYIIAVETRDYFLSTIILINHYWKALGLAEIFEIISRIKYHIDNNIWNLSKEENELGYLPITKIYHAETTI